MDELTLFKKELEELLNKYNAELSLDYDDSSDMNSVYDLRIIAMINNKQIDI